MEFDPNQRKEQEPIQGKVIKQATSDEQAAIEDVVSSLRLLTGAPLTTVQEAEYPGTSQGDTDSAKTGQRELADLPKDNIMRVTSGRDQIRAALGEGVSKRDIKKFRRILNAA